MELAKASDEDDDPDIKTKKFDATEAELTAICNDQEKTMAMWDRLDVNGSGKSSLAEIEKFVVDQYPLLNNNPALMRAYKRTLIKKGGGDGDDWVEKKEFSELLRNLVYYNRLFAAFDKIDSGDDKSMDIAEFRAGVKSLGMNLTEEESQEEFEAMDSNGGGQVLFDELCEWYLEKKGVATSGSTATDPTVAKRSDDYPDILTSPANAPPAKSPRAKDTASARENMFKSSKDDQSEDTISNLKKMNSLRIANKKLKQDNTRLQDELQDLRLNMPRKPNRAEARGGPEDARARELANAHHRLDIYKRANEQLRKQLHAVEPERVVHLENLLTQRNNQLRQMTNENKSLILDLRRAHKALAVTPEMEEGSARIGHLEIELKACKDQKARLTRKYDQAERAMRQQQGRLVYLENKVRTSPKKKTNKTKMNVNLNAPAPPPGPKPSPSLRSPRPQQPGDAEGIKDRPSGAEAEDPTFLTEPAGGTEAEGSSRASGSARDDGGGG